MLNLGSLNTFIDIKLCQQFTSQYRVPEKHFITKPSANRTRRVTEIPRNNFKASRESSLQHQREANFYPGLLQRPIPLQEINPQTLKLKHQLLRTMYNVQQQQKKIQVDDSAFVRLQKEVEDKSPQRTQRRAYEVEEFKRMNEILTNNLIQENQPESTSDKPKVIKQIQNKINRRKLIMQFPEQQWLRMRGMSERKVTEERKVSISLLTCSLVKELGEAKDISLKVDDILCRSQIN